jgi:hypothetical protein
MKYVAFIDILGFKDRIKNCSHEQAGKLVSEFSQLVYHEWGKLGNDTDSSLSGLIVSDCVIVHTNSCNPLALKKLFEFLVVLFQKSAFEKTFLLRAAVAKGEFDKLPSFSYENLSKNLIVGQAYIDAYLLEGLFKGSIITFGKDIFDDFDEINNFSYKISQITQKNKSTTTQNQTYFYLRWAKLSELLIDSHLDHFVSLGVEGKWLPHYYQTIYMFMEDTTNEEKNELLERVWVCIKKIDNNFRFYADLFIRNAFAEDVEFNMQKHVARFIREKINDSNSIQIAQSNELY